MWFAGTISPIALSDDDFCDLMSEDSDQGHGMPGTEETCDKESGCESEEESDDESVVEEKDASMPQLMDPSEPEDSKDEHKPTSIYIQGDDARITTFGLAAPSTFLCDSSATISYMRSTEILGPCERRLYPYFLRQTHCVRFYSHVVVFWVRHPRTRWSDG